MNLYALTVPVFIRGISNMIRIIDLMEKHAKAKKIDPSIFLGGRLAPNMFTFIQQIQYIYFDVTEMVGPLSGKTPPAFSYKEATADDLRKSLQKTLIYLKKIKPADYSNSDKTKISLYWNRKKELKAHDYVTKVGLPNFYFHSSVAYGIFRHLGVPLAKDDYLGKL